MPFYLYLLIVIGVIGGATLLGLLLGHVAWKFRWFHLCWEDPEESKYRNGLKSLKAEYGTKCLRGGRKPKDGWQRDWGWIVKYDRDFDYQYLFEIVLFKLKRMRLYFDCFAVTDATDAIASMDKAIAVGDRILADEYDAEGDAFAEQHCTSEIIILEKNGLHEIGSIPCQGTSAFGGMDIQAAVDAWCEKHGVPRSDVECGMRMGAWDSQENRDAWNRMIENGHKAMLDDYREFFRIVGERITDWWD